MTDQHSRDLQRVAAGAVGAADYEDRSICHRGLRRLPSNGLSRTISMRMIGGRFGAASQEEQESDRSQSRGRLGDGSGTSLGGGAGFFGGGGDAPDAGGGGIQGGPGGHGGNSA